MLLKTHREGREPARWPTNYWCQTCTWFNPSRKRSLGKAIKPPSFPPSHLLAATKLNDLLHKVFSLYCPTPCRQLATTTPLLQITFVVLAPMEEWWGPGNLPQLGEKNTAPTRERVARGVTTWQSTHKVHDKCLRTPERSFTWYFASCTLWKKEINPGHHCLNLKYPGWQSFRIYSLALDVSLFPFSHSRYLASPSYSFYLFTKMSLFLINIQTQGS